MRINPKYFFKIEAQNLESAAKENSPSLLVKGRDADTKQITYLGCLLIAKGQFTYCIKKDIFPRLVRDTCTGKEGDIRNVVQRSHLIDFYLLADENLMKRFSLKSPIWKEGFSICRLCKNLMQNLQRECDFPNKNCKIEWKI